MKDLLARIFTPEKLSSKIFGSIIAIVFVLILALLLLIDTGVRNEVEQNIAKRLMNTDRALRELDDVWKERVRARLQYFVRRPGFSGNIRKALAGNSKSLKKQFARVVGYDFFRVVNLDNERVIADSLSRKAEGKKIKANMAYIIDAVRDNERSFGTIEERGAIFQSVAQLLLVRGKPVALVAGRPVDKQFTFKVDEVTGNKATFVVNNKVIASTFQDEKNLKEIEAQVPGIIKKFAEHRKKEAEKAKEESESSSSDDDVVEPGDDEESSGVSVGEDDTEAEEPSVHTESLTLTNARGESEEFLVFLDSLAPKGVGTFLIASSKSKQLAFLTTIEFIIVAAGLGGLAFAFLVGFLISRTITRNVNQLVGDVEVIKEGNLDHEVKVESKDEIGFLGEQFDSLRVAFKASQAQLRDYADNLEEKVKERTAELTMAKKETDQIMDTVDQGLFLLHKQDDSFTVGSQYSAALKNILEADDPGNKDLMLTVKSFANDKVVANTEKYLNLMFTKGHSEKMLNKLNPLRQIEAAFGHEKNKHLEFHFNRITHEKEIQHLMATVTDVTQEVLLQKKLQETEEENKRQMELLFTILKIEPQVLSDFISDIEEDLELINQTLKGKGEQTRDSLLQRLDIIYRSMHTIKGNASLLNLTVFSDRAHAYEDVVSELIEKPDLSASDFLGLVLKLNEFHDTLREVKSLINRLTAFQQAMTADKSKKGDLTISALETTIQRLGVDLGKEVLLNYDHYDPAVVPRSYRKLMKDVLVQLVRNSMSHGIETLQERQTAGKDVKGKIKIATQLDGDKLVIKFRDDGRGIQLDKLRTKAANSDKYDAEEVKGWSDGRVAQLIYETGLSTAESTTMNAGRGVGMDIIKQKVNEAGGSIGLSFKPGQFCEFSLSLPREA